MKYRVLAADDEPLALQRLELAILCIPEAELVGLCPDGRTAVDATRALKPDIVILDIRMPKLSGFEVVRALEGLEPRPGVIFLTAFEEHARKAFDVQAADYLVKPVAFERLRTAIRTAGARLQARDAEARFTELERRLELAQGATSADTPFDRELWVRERDGLTRVAVEHIERLEADGDYVIARTEEKEHLLRDSITALAGRLDPARFLRVHRSTIVNLGHVRRLSRRTRRTYALVLRSGAQVAVGPMYADAVLAALKADRWR